jgi:hypothetical protein
MGTSVTKAYFGVIQKNGNWVRDERTNGPKEFTTKRQAYLEYGPDANVQPMTVTYEQTIPAKKKRA